MSRIIGALACMMLAAGWMPANATGSAHAAPLAANDTDDLELLFQDCSRITGVARVLAPGAALTGHHHEQGDEAGH